MFAGFNMPSLVYTTSPRALRRRPQWLIPVFVLCAGAVACSEDPTRPDPVPAASIELPTDTLALYVGESVSFLPVVSGPFGREIEQPEIVLTAVDSNVMRIDSDGTVRAVAHGITQLQVEADTLTAFVPVRVTEFAQIGSIGRDLCALDVDGVVWCRGLSHSGILGPSPSYFDEFRRVNTDLRFQSIAVGQHHVCGIANGKTYCWGDNEDGLLGRGAWYINGLPDTVHGGHAFVSLTAGYEHTCALDAAGAAWCWGRPWEGQLGRGDTFGDFERPAPVATGLTWTTLDAGFDATCGVATDGVTYCWGTLNESTVPGPVAGMPANATSLSADASLTCAGSGMTVVCQTSFYWWGDPRSFSGTVTLPDPVISLSSWYQYACAVVEGGEVYCWGPEAGAFLGNGTSGGSTEPVPITSDQRFTDAVSAASHACGLTGDGALYCWGPDVFDGTGLGSSLPVRVGAPRP